MTSNADEGKAGNVADVGFSKVFSTVFHNILTDKL